MKPEGLVILISGRGSNAMALVDAAARGALPIPVNAVVADRPAAGVQLAADKGVDTATVPRNSFPDRNSFEAALTETIAGFRPRLIALAGARKRRALHLEVGRPPSQLNLASRKPNTKRERAADSAWRYGKPRTHQICLSPL